MIDPGLTLMLAGYVALTECGFALPCFATSPRPNVWYTATCSVDADHAGQIAGFGVFVSDKIVPLSSEYNRQIAVGGPWIDVFLWKGNVLIGTPREIWNSLEAAREEMLSTVPLTGLDLALGIPDQDVAPLVTSALEFMRSRFGIEKAQYWRYEILVRQQLLVGIRRRLRAAGCSQEAYATAADLEIVPTGLDQAAVKLPQQLVQEFARLGRVEELDDQIRATAERLAVGLDRIVEEASKDEATKLEASSNPTSHLEDAGARGAVRILIVATEGKRARDIARHVSQPEWAPNWIESGPVILNVVTPNKDAAARLSKYDVAVLLVDEGEAQHQLIFNARNMLSASQGPNWDGITLLAPALPEDAPSELLLNGAAARTELESIDFDAVIDTAVARSPFWTGNPRRSLNRRIADIIVGAALLCGGDSPLRKHLKMSHRDREWLLAFAMTPDVIPDDEKWSASETLWADTRRSVGKTARVDFWATTRRAGADSVQHGVVQLRERGKGFDDFVRAILAEKTSGFELVTGSVPARLREQLRWPFLCVGCRYRGSPFKGIAICAETPTFAAVRDGDMEGWVVVRYTDVESIVEVTRFEADGRFSYLPHQIRLPNLIKRSANRGLATRGIDPRDVVRLTPDQWQKWKPRLSRFLRGEVRRYRTSFLPRRSGKLEVSEEFVLPRLDLELDDHRASVALLREIDHRDPRTSTSKRLADLEVAWSRPAKGLSRYILADGVIPCELAELEPDEVPAQRFFIVDGDAGVPALLGSRIFSVWAKLTLTRSTSWMSRFSVSRTFETFPVPSSFVVDRREGGPSQLKLSANAELRDLAKRFRIVHRRGAIDAAQELQAEIDKILLGHLGLGRRATDLEIAERLLREGASGR